MTKDIKLNQGAHILSFKITGEDFDLYKSGTAWNGWIISSRTEDRCFLCVNGMGIDGSFNPKNTFIQFTNKDKTLSSDTFHIIQTYNMADINFVEANMSEIQLYKNVETSITIFYDVFIEGEQVTSANYEFSASGGTFNNDGEFVNVSSLSVQSASTSSTHSFYMTIDYDGTYPYGYDNLGIQLTCTEYPDLILTATTEIRISEEATSYVFKPINSEFDFNDMFEFRLDDGQVDITKIDWLEIQFYITQNSGQLKYFLGIYGEEDFYGELSCINQCAEFPNYHDGTLTCNDSTYNIEYIIDSFDSDYYDLETIEYNDTTISPSGSDIKFVYNSPKIIIHLTLKNQ